MTSLLRVPTHRRVVPWGAGVVGALTVVLGLRAPLEAQRWRPEDRVLLTSFHLVSALARDERHLYAVSSEGLEILDMAARRWELPSTAEDGFPRDEQPSAAAFDALDRTLWVATLEGSLYSYQVDLRRWTLETTPGAGPFLRAAWLRGGDREGLYLRSPSGWIRMSSFGSIPERVPAAGLPRELRSLELGPEERLARTDPAFAAARGTVLMDEHATRWPLTDFVAAPDPGRYWLATAGDNLYLYDSRFVTADPYRFGLLSPSARSMAADGRTIWFGGDGRGPRRGVTRGSEDLQEWRWHEARAGGAPGTAVTDIVVGGDAVWFGTAQGVYRLGRGGDDWRRMGGLAGSVRVRRLVAGPDGSVWAATDKGLLRVGAGQAADLAEGPELRTVAFTGDTLWVGGDGGVRRFLISGDELDWPPGGPPPPGGRIVDLVRAGDDVWMATDGGALWRFGADGWEGPLREASQGGVDEILRLRARDDVLWAAGTGGVARRAPDTGEWDYLLVGRDLLGGPVWDVLPTREGVFVATPEGVMRLDWREAR